MSDNLTTPVPSGTVLATKDMGSSLHLPKNTIVDQTNTDAVGAVTASPAPNTILGRLKAIADAIAGSLTVTGTFWQATQPVSAAALPLPTGAATAAKQDALVTLLTGGLGVTGTFWQTTQPISASALPLPTGAATSANQSTANTTLSSIDTKVTGLATAANQSTAQTSFSAIATSTALAAPATVYVPITPGSSNLASGACKAIVAEVAGRVNLKQPDGTIRANYPLQAGLNAIGALVIDAPTSGTAATGIWALYN